jgi:hypothetical protein
VPVNVQQNLPPLRQDLIPLLQDMRSVVLAMRPPSPQALAIPPPELLATPGSPSLRPCALILLAKFDGAGIFAVLGQSAVKGFSGGPVCLPPGANVFHAGQHTGEDASGAPYGAPCKNESMQGGRPIIVKWMISVKTRTAVSS